MDEKTFISALGEYGIQLSSKQLSQFEQYHELLVDWNERMNLTGITDKEEVYLKHFYDSLSVGFFCDLSSKTVCDIGSGAGFPGIPLKIVYPDLKMTLVDSLNKRIGFLKHVVEKLGLEGIEVVCSRAEEVAEKQREDFDVVTARAVANLSILSELCMPLVKVGGMFVAMKGGKALEELEGAKTAIKKLGGSVSVVEEFAKLDIEQRANIYVSKNSVTPKQYPRMYSKIKKSPL